MSAALLLAFGSTAQILINELVASSDSATVCDGEDWVELHNWADAAYML